MKVTKIGDDLEIFIINRISDDIFNNKKELDIWIKQIFNNIEKYYLINLSGLYKIKIYPNVLGIFVRMIKIDNEIYDDSTLDYKIIVIYNRDIYFKYDDYFLLDNNNAIYKDNNYYLNIKYIENYSLVADYGELVLI